MYDITMRVMWPALIVTLLLGVGCTAPTYLSVPPAVPGDYQSQGLSPSAPGLAIVRDQHLGQLQADMHYLEEVVLRAERDRLRACQIPEAVQPNSVAYQRCQFKDQLYEQLKSEAAIARDRYLRAVSGRGGPSR